MKGCFSHKHLKNRYGIGGAIFCAKKHKIFGGTKTQVSAFS
jgi:hypothetical protein